MNGGFALKGLAAHFPVVALAVLVSACGPYVPIPQQADVRGSCTLDLVLDSGKQLEAPYVVTMQPTRGGHPEASVNLQASGWGSSVQWGVTAPRGPLGELPQDGAKLNAGSMAQMFNEPGTWVLELEDRNCYRRIPVEVRPPGG